MLPDLLPIVPFTRPVQGEVLLPGSKSLTNRALLLSSLCDKPVTLVNALFSDDTRLMAAALRAMGIAVTENERERTIVIEGRGGAFPAERAELFVGNAGTAARFLTALCAAAPRGLFRIDGVPQMRLRPMAGLIAALRAMGARITCEEREGHFPLVIEAHGIAGGEVEIDASESSQMLSALLMVAPLARRTMEIKLLGNVRKPFVAMTSQLMMEFGAGGVRHKRIYGTPGSFSTEPMAYRSPGTFAIEPDATAASYFLALPLVTGGSLLLPHLRMSRSLQGDIRFVSVLREVGAKIEERAHPAGREGERAVEVSATAGTHRGIDADFEEFSDTFLTLAAISPLLDRTTRITGIAHTRKQETDRVAGMARELMRLGQNVEEDEGALTIVPRPLEPDTEIETYQDHRFAMSFAILGCYDLRRDGRPWLSIRNPACCAKTFPEFFELLESLRKKTVGA